MLELPTTEPSGGGVTSGHNTGERREEERAEGMVLGFNVALRS